MKQFEISESDDPDGVIRLRLLGELDVAVADMLERRLVDLRRPPRDARIDLSCLRFIDSTGLRALLLGLRGARSDGRRLDIDPHVSQNVAHTIEITGLRSHIWPRDE